MREKNVCFSDLLISVRFFLKPQNNSQHCQQHSVHSEQNHFTHSWTRAMLGPTLRTAFQQTCQVSEWREQGHLKQHGLCKCDLIASTGNGSDLSQENQGPYWPQWNETIAFLSISSENIALWWNNDTWIHFNLLCFPLLACIAVVDLLFFSFWLNMLN